MPECEVRTDPLELKVPRFLMRRFYHRCLDRLQLAGRKFHRYGYQSEPLYVYRLMDDELF